MSSVRLLHVSDLHFGIDNLPEQVEKIETLVARGGFDAVAVSGDLTQRARAREFAQAKAFIEHCEANAQVIVVPGNHDVAWWRAPLHLGLKGWIYSKWNAYLGRELEPVLRLPGATIVGVNTSHGLTRHTLTRRPRDLTVIGDLRDEQIDHVRRAFATSAQGDRRVVVMHHNPVAGEISRRLGLSHSAYVLDRFASLGVDLILCGHDHQEAIHYAERVTGNIVVSTAGTITTRSRGGRPQAINAIKLDEQGIAVRTLVWDAGRRDFVVGVERRFGR